MESTTSNKVHQELIERLLKLGNHRLNNVEEISTTNTATKKSDDLSTALEDGLNYLDNVETQARRRKQMQEDWKNKIKEYSDRIHNLTQHKNIKLPFMIHKETETCIADFRDLQANLNDGKRRNDKLTNYHKQATKINQKLKNDLDLITDYLSFIDTKLSDIAESGNLLENERLNVSTALAEIREKTNNTQKKYELVTAQVNERRSVMQDTEKRLENELAEKIARLEELGQNKTYEKKRSQKNKILSENKAKELIKMEQNLKMAEIDRSTKVKEYDRTLKDLKKTQKIMQINQRSIDKKEQELKATELKCKDESAALEQQTKQKEIFTDKLKRNEIDAKVKIEERRRKTANLEQEIEEDELLKTRLDEQVEKCVEEIDEQSNKLLSVLETRDDLQTEYSKNSANNNDNEEATKRGIMAKKESLSQVLARKSMLEANIVEHARDHKLFVKENEIRTKLLSNKHAKNASLQKEMETHKNEEQTRLEEIQKKVDGIQSQIDLIMEERNELYGLPLKRLNFLKQESIDMQETHAGQFVTIEGLKDHLIVLGQEISESDNNINGMILLTNSLHSELTKANYQLTCLTEQSECSERLLNAIKIRFQTLVGQISFSDSLHKDAMAELHHHSNEISREINSNLCENEEMAEEFKRTNFDISERKSTTREFYGTLFELVRRDQLITQIKYLVDQWLTQLGGLNEFNVSDLNSKLSNIVQKTIFNDGNMQYFLDGMSKDSNELYDYARIHLTDNLRRGHF